MADNLKKIVLNDSPIYLEVPSVSDSHIFQSTSIKSDLFTLQQMEGNTLRMIVAHQIDPEQLQIILQKGHPFGKAFVSLYLQNANFHNEIKQHAQNLQQMTTEQHVPQIQPESLPEFTVPTKGTVLSEQQLTIPVCNGAIERAAIGLRDVIGDRHYVELAVHVLQEFLEIQKMINGSNNAVSELQTANHLIELINSLKKFAEFPTIEAELGKSEIEIEKKIADCASLMENWKSVELRPLNGNNLKLFAETLDSVKNLLEILKVRISLCKENASNHKNFSYFMDTLSDAVKHIDLQIEDLHTLIESCNSDIRQIQFNMKANKEFAESIFSSHETKRQNLDAEDNRLQNYLAEITMQMQILNLKFCEGVRKQNEVKAIKKSDADFVAKFAEELKKTEDAGANEISKRESRKEGAKIYINATEKYKQHYTETSNQAHAIEVTKKEDHFKLFKRELFREYKGLQDQAYLARGRKVRCDQSLRYLEDALARIEIEAEHLQGSAVDEIEKKANDLTEQKLMALNTQDEMEDVLNSVDKSFHTLINDFYMCEKKDVKDSNAAIDPKQAKFNKLQITDPNHNRVFISNPRTEIELIPPARPSPLEMQSIEDLKRAVESHRSIMTISGVSDSNSN